MDEGKFTGGELEKISHMLNDRVEDHRAELLSPVIGKDGSTMDVVRHNGIEEIGHRWSRMHIRRRTGRSQTSREMAMYGALTAILSNIENDYYLKHILSGMDFLKEYMSITKEEMTVARKLIRRNPCEAIVRKDSKRMPVLQAFVNIIEVHENVTKSELKKWLGSIKI